MDDNLKMLEKLEQVATIEQKLEKLCSELGSLNYVELMNRKQQLCREIMKINAEVRQQSLFDVNFKTM